MKAIRKRMLAFIACIAIILVEVMINVPAYALENVTGTATIKADSLNVRTGPGKDYDAMGKVYEGNVVNVVGVDGEWLKIEYQSSEGYIASEYTEFEPDEIEEVVEENTEETQAPVETNETEDEPVFNYKLIFGLIGAIIVILIVILVTIKSIKNMDDYSDDDYSDDDDDYEDDDYDEDEYDDEDDEEEYDEDEDDEEYEYVMVRRPKQKSSGQSANYKAAGQSRSGQSRGGQASQQARRQPIGQQKGEKRMDDYTIDIDPSFFE